MKNRVYKIKDKILVRGNENELTKDEVLVKEENGSVILKERVNGEVINVVASNNGLGIEYLSANSDSLFKLAFGISAYLGKIRMGNIYSVLSYGLILEALDAQPDAELVGVAIIPDAKLLTDGKIRTVKEALIEVLGEETYNLLPRITEEEFYNITE